MMTGGFRVGLIASGVVMLLASPAAAQSHRQLFVAPSGEPFRAAEGQPYPVATWFAQADFNHDGKIESYEFLANVAAYFDRLDINHDGVIEPDEVRGYENHELPGVLGVANSTAWRGGEAYSKAPAPGGDDVPDRKSPGVNADSTPGGSDGGGRSSPDQDDASIQRSKLNAAAFQSDLMSGAGRFGLIPIPQPITAMDSNFDGRISKAEMTAAANRRFKMLAGGNDYLTLDTLPRTAVQRR